MQNQTSTLGPSSGSRRGESGAISVAGVLHVSRKLNDFLVPVTPREVFRSELRDRLVASARYHYAERAMMDVMAETGTEESTTAAIAARMSGWWHGEDSSSKALVWGAAVGSAAVSVMGALCVAYVWRDRSRRAA